MSKHPDSIQRLIEHHKQDCNRYVNGQCSVRRCMVRGGWSFKNPVGFEAATCEAHETVVLLSAIAKGEASR